MVIGYLQHMKGRLQRNIDAYSTIVIDAQDPKLLQTTGTQEIALELPAGVHTNQSDIPPATAAHTSVRFQDTLKKIPKHIAVVMDGNRRWGKLTHADPLQGHWTGGQKLIDFVQWCIEDGVKILTIYAFSSENWNRDPKEIAMLMGILIKYVHDLKKEALSKDIRVNILSTGGYYFNFLKLTVNWLFLRADYFDVVFKW